MLKTPKQHEIRRGVPREEEQKEKTTTHRDTRPFTFTFRAFGRRFYTKRLTKSTFVEGEAAIYHCGT